MMTYELDEVEKRALLETVIDRARADLNEGRPLTEIRALEPPRPRYGDVGPPPEDLEMFPDPPRPKLSEELAELRDDAERLAYTAIRLSGLHRELSEPEWDAMAVKLGGQVLGLINQAIDGEFTRIESERSQER